MRLPSITQYRAQMQLLSSEFDKLSSLQTKAGTGKKLLRSSDNPILADRIKSVQNYLGQLKNFDSNVTLADNRQSQKSYVAAQSLALIGKVQQLLQSGQNETLNDSDREIISKELDGILEQALVLSNTRDANNEYIYSGYNPAIPAFRNEGNQYIYQGSVNSSKISIGLQARVNYSEVGGKVFANILNGNGAFQTNADLANNNGTAIIRGGHVVSPADYVADSYTITIVANTAGKPAVQVIGATSGQIIPALPANVPGDAPDYIDGNDLVFNGLAINLSGQPQVGDTFRVSPSQGQSVFSAISDLANVLHQPIKSEKDRSNFQQIMGGLSETMQQIYEHFRSYQQTVGNDGKIIDNQKNLMENLITDETLKLSNLSDADMPEVLTQITQRMTSLQLTQQIYLKIQETQQMILNQRR